MYLVAFVNGHKALLVTVDQKKAHPLITLGHNKRFFAVLMFSEVESTVTN